jgi:aryl-alcohol dehydrogenase-like predicted oxidoreductase
MTTRITIPDTDLNLCPIGLGTAVAGLAWDYDYADKLLGTYLDLGGNVIDTARVYSDWVPSEIGRSERVIGDWLQRSGKRCHIILMTKGGHPKFTSPSDDLHIPRMTRADMRQDIELSLKALRVDTIDIYFYHRDNRSQSVEEEIETMEQFLKEGKIRYYGCSNWQADRIRKSDTYCAGRGYRGFIADQALLNLGIKYIDHLPDNTLVPMKGDLFRYHTENLKNLAMPYMGIANGFFHTFAAKGRDAVKENPYCTPQNLKVANHCTDLMQRYGASVSQVVLGFFSHQPFPCVPLIGPKNVEQLKDAMGATNNKFRSTDFDI